MASTGIRRFRDSNSRTAELILNRDRIQLDSEKVFPNSNIITGVNGPGASNQGTDAGNYQSSSGGEIGGPQGNQFNIVDIISDFIDASITSLNYFGFLILNGEGGSDDSLSSINAGEDPLFNHELYLQAGLQSITLKEILTNSDPILTPGGTDLVILAGDIAKLVYSNIISAWVVLTSSEV